MKTIHIEKKDVPRALIGSYNGQKFKAVVCESVTLQGTYWSGGSRSSYSLAQLKTGASVAAPGNDAPPEFGGNMEGKTINIKPGYAVIEHSIFCGKDMGLTFYIHPDNAAKLIPAPADELSLDELIVLEFTASLKSFARLDEAQRMTGITQDRWNAAKAKLIDQKYLRKNGSITPAGRNQRPYEFNGMYQLGQRAKQ